MARVKAKQHENLSEINVKRVIELLEAEKPISKKDACQILNITYNTTRLNRIIEEYREGQATQARLRAANRGKPATPSEIQTVIESYLDGQAISDIAKSIFRPTSFVKEVVEKVGVPQRVVGADYTNPGIIPEQCISESFEKGQIVWHARRHCMAIVREQQYNVRDKTHNY